MKCIKQAFYILLLCVCLSATTHAQQAKHLILVTIDGFRPDFYLDPSWGAVNLRQLMQQGVYAQGVNGVFPSVTYPSHTTIVTGVKPLKHGIYYNTPFEPEGATGRWYWDAAAIQSPTLWDAVRKAGMKSASLCWPVSVGAPIDFNVPEVFPLTGVSSDRRESASKNATPAGLFEELQQNATGVLEEKDFTLKGDYLAMDENVARMGAYLIKKQRPALFTIHMACVDHAEHEQGRDGPMVRRAVAGADRAIRTLVEAVNEAGMADSTAIIVTGDHGFVDINTLVQPNVWLTNAGLMGDIKKGEWKAQFHTNGGSIFLHLKDPADSTTLHKVIALLDKLPVAQKKLFRVIDRKAMDEAGADPHAALALTAAQGIVFGGGSKGEAIMASPSSLKGMHGYFPDFHEIQTGFIGAGAGFKTGVVIPVMGLEDIAPVAASLLGIPFPSADGILFKGVLNANK